MIKLVTYGIEENAAYFRRLGRVSPKALEKAKRRIAQSVMMKARRIIETDTIPHTGVLRGDVRMRPNGTTWQIIAGENAPYANIIEDGRKSIVGYRFVPTQQFPLEGFAIKSPGRIIRSARGIHFMLRAAEYGQGRARSIVASELNKVTK